MRKNLFVLAFSFTLLVSCSFNNGTNVESESTVDTISIVDSESSVEPESSTESESGVEMIKEQADAYNMTGGQSLSDTPMANVRHLVDENKRLYIFEYLWNEDFGDIESLDHASRMKEVAKEMSSNPASLNFMKLLAKEKYGIMFRVEGSKTHKKIENKVSYQEIVALIDKAEQVP